MKTDAATRFHGNYIPEPNSGCFLWIGGLAGHKGYGAFTLGRERQAHRASWIINRGPIPAGLWVLHKCDVSCCVNPEHLYLGTIVENTRDMMSRRRHFCHTKPWLSVRGDRHGNALLSNEKVAEIKRRLARGDQGSDIAKDYGVEKSTIYLIKRGQTWRHIPND